MKNKILHQYPTSWRSRKPVIFRSTNQWFIDIKNLKNLGIEEALKVKWYPANSRERFISTLERRESWCISRQRMWGTPICLFHQNGKILLDQNVLAKTLDYLRNNGIQSWWSDDAARIILGDQWQNYEKVKDIVDVWLESGSTQYFVLKKRNKHPADLYLEGSDQHRAWFQSSMMVSLVTSGCAPYKKVKTHGYVVDVNGRKMSKSLGNGKSPQEILKEHGPDVLRLWVLGQNTSMDVVFSENQLLSCKKIEHKVRNTLKFMIQNGKKHDIEYNSLPLLEKHLLNRIYQIQDLFVEVSETLEFHELMHELYLFCENDLSKLYFDIRKDALYWENNLLKKQVENCLHIGFQYLVRWIAPYMPFAAEDAWQTWLEHNEMDCSSIHITSLPEVDPQWKNASDAKKMDMIFDLRDRVNVEVERLREKGTVKAAIDCHIDLYLPKEDNKAANCKDLAGELELIRQVCIISSLNIHESISASPATGSKCSKCKRWWAETMQNLCARCYKLFGAQDLGD
jgi:isoleucyl-tRNA synthetase